MSEKKVMKLNLNKETVEILSAKSMVNIVGGKVGERCLMDAECPEYEYCNTARGWGECRDRSELEGLPPVSHGLCSKSSLCGWTNK